jgi:single-stranded-DNA-specific exonuclease
LRTLLFFRGIEDVTKAHEFLNPNYTTGIHDPFLMKDMDKAVERIIKAIEENQNILIYSDYDADGIPAAVIMHDFFKGIGYSNFEIYIPHRHHEGYGLHIEAIDTFKEKNIKLMITLDCGIVDNAEVEHAMNLGIDVIITDHHLPGEKLPNAYAVLNSKREDCEYPYDMLCGSGVAFKLVQALLVKLPEAKKNNFKDGKEKWLLDMVGLATLSDMVPLQGENRVLAHYGLKVLRKSRRPGFIKLLGTMNMKQQYISEDDIGFMITPRINAASRMGIPHDAFKLLSTQDQVEGGLLAKHLDTINNERKGLVAALVKEIKKIMSERSDYFADKAILVLGNPEWRPAILGLVANNLVEQYNKPVFLWGREGGADIKGSCRSDGTVDVVKLMEASKEAFSQFGGHAMSGGFAVEHTKIHELENILLAKYALQVQNNKEPEKIYIDAKINLDDVNWANYNLIEKLAPFGKGNPKPLFIFENITLFESKQFGKRQEHLELSFHNSQNKKIKAIGFFIQPEDFGVPIKKDIPMNLIATFEKSYFKSFPELRLRIVEII